MSFPPFIPPSMGRKGGPPKFVGLVAGYQNGGTVALPAGCQAGDMVVFVTWVPGTAGVGTPTGMTALGAQGAGTTYGMTWGYYSLTGANIASGTLPVPTSNTSTPGFSYLIFRNVRPPTAKAAEGNYSTGVLSQTSSAITKGSSSAFLLMLVGSDGSTASISSMTPAGAVDAKAAGAWAGGCPCSYVPAANFTSGSTMQVVASGISGNSSWAAVELIKG